MSQILTYSLFLVLLLNMRMLFVLL